MIVTMQDRGSGVFGLRSGVRDARRCFKRSAPAVDLDLESVQIRCELRQEFWRGILRSGIRDCAHGLPRKRQSGKLMGIRWFCSCCLQGPMCFGCGRGSQRETWIARGTGSIASRDGW